MNQGLFKGTLFITIAALVSKALGSLIRIPVQNIAGDQVLGIFTLVYPLYMVSLTLSVAGIPLAISKMISEARARHSKEEIRNIFVTASILAFSFGAFGFLILAGFSVPISRAFGGSSTRPAILAVSFSLLVAPYMAVYRGYFQGFGDMRQTAVSQVFEQFIRVAVILAASLVFVYLGSSDSVIATGIMAGSSIGALASLFYLRAQFTQGLLLSGKKTPYHFSLFCRLGGRILKLSIPIAIGSLTVALLNLVDSFTIPAALDTQRESMINELYGIYGRGISVVQMATVFSTSLVLPMVPAVSSAIVKENRIRTNQMIAKAQKYNHMIAWPAALGAASLALPLNLALFGDLQGTSVLALLGASSLFNAFALLGVGILLGIGLHKEAALLVLGAALLKIPLNIVLVHQMGLVGAALSSLIIYGLLASANTVLTKKRYVFKVFPKGTGAYIAGGCFIGIMIGLPTLLLNVHSWGRAAAAAYLIVAIFTSAVLYMIIVWRMNGAEDFSQFWMGRQALVRFGPKRNKKRG
ncbi:MAG TPA: polysaccharide biosynthesis protein [Bacillales bacterium]|nr:polysaccharide biosynthesis protein [Bacillales bacterium]